MVSPAPRLVAVVIFSLCLLHAQCLLYDRNSGTSLHRNDDGYSGRQTISMNFKFFGSTYNTLYVCTNGIISFGGGISSYTPTPFPIASRPVVAPFWGDVDIRRSGAIRYRQVTSGDLLRTLTDDINDEYDSVVPNFWCTWAYVVTWDNVPAYPGGGSGNTFQAVLASDGTYAFVIYNYEHIGWTYGSASRGISAQVGFDAGNRRNYYAHEWSRSGSIANIDTESNCNTRGRWMFRVDLTEIVPVEEVPQCDTGYTGDNCGQCASGYVRSGSFCVVNHCANHNCANGNCVNGNSGFTCSCNAGWIGSTCATRDYCHGQSCSGHGSCSNNPSSYTCNCHTGYSGSTCQNCATAYVRSGSVCVVNYCYQQTCSGFGTCNNGQSSYTCSCNTGYTGSNCQSCAVDYIRSGNVCVRNYCYQQTCSGFGSCANGASTFTCHCNTGYAGTTCGNCATAYTRSGQYCVVDYCYQQECSNVGRCFNGATDFTCHCQRGYTGTNCQNCATAFTRSGGNCVTDYCYGQTCSSHGTCSNGASAYSCNCNTGYTGTNCEACATAYVRSGTDCVTDYCHGQTCSGHGSCNNGASGYTCSCNTGYTGTTCNSCDTGFIRSGNVCVVDYCYEQTCTGVGTCHNGGSDYTCACNTGYAGRNCESCATAYTRSAGVCVTDYCYEVNCNQGNCINGDSGYTCSCATGYIGNNCETRDYCYGQSCSNQGDCINGASSYTCSCRTPYYGTNCENTNYCQQNNVDCLNGGICQITTGECQCESRFVGGRCENCHSDWTGSGCSTRYYCNGHSCMNGATCNNGGNGYTCYCAHGYIGTYCEQYNLCTYNSIQCNNGGACGSRTGQCTCPQEFTGTFCDDCADGYTGDGCSLIDYCYGNVCQNGAECQNGYSDYSCTCPRDSNNAYLGDLCEIRDTCFERNPQCNQGSCYNLGPGGYDCQCEGHWCDGDGGECNACCDGWTEPENNCDTIDYCYLHECQNGATCNNGESGYTCTCPHEWTGNRCEVRDYCTTHLLEGNGAYTSCQHNGTCVNVEAGWACECFDEHFTGMYCERCSAGWTGNCYVIDHCFGNGCQNEATCNNRPELGIYTCTCPHEYSGVNCEIRDWCRTELEEGNRAECENEATCMNNADGWECECVDNHFTNTYCQDCSAGWTDDCYVVDFCHGNECRNGATCINHPDTVSYTCQCTDEYTGEFCEQYDYCSVNNIVCDGLDSDAVCVNGEEGGSCQCNEPFTGDSCTECVDGWTGRRCHQIDYCSGRNCGTGTCRNRPNRNTYECICPDGFSGGACETVDYCTRDVRLGCPRGSQCRNNDASNGYVCDFCHDYPCINGTCNSLNDGYSCTCHATETVTFYGNRCQHKNYCNPNPCYNGGTCTNEPDERLHYTCTCTSEWGGKQCEFLDQCDGVECGEDETCSTTSNSTHSCVQNSASSANAQAGGGGDGNEDDNTQGGLSQQQMAMIGAGVACAVGLAGIAFLIYRRNRKKKDEEEMKRAFEQQDEPDEARVEETERNGATTARDITIEDAEEGDMWA